MEESVEGRVVAVGHKNGIVDEVIVNLPDNRNVTISRLPYGGDFDDDDNRVQVVIGPVSE